jgi:hypothetical protein
MTQLDGTKAVKALKRMTWHTRMREACKHRSQSTDVWLWWRKDGVVALH